MLEDEIEDLVNDLLEQENQSNQKSTQIEPTHADRGRCAPVLLAGMSLACGVSTPKSPRCCTRLRCASCDFGVVVFHGKRWLANTDHLFLRNHVPDGNLKSQLASEAGGRAFACQCRCVSVRRNESKTVSALGLRWFCIGGDHSRPL
ncbi:protein C8orf37 homolog [Galendromus occidentalis]|uniref:Cilia- and flagella-associated protein 418 n=1 Tax=Galendromus occidentalis TaxID=34638 RepID=A0AAJ7WJ81_9ACAR|nr:protein C8orf37 homolog [Galendromus occidentalis]